MFRAPLHPSSGAHDDSVGYHTGRPVLELLLDGSLIAGRMDEINSKVVSLPRQHQCFSVSSFKASSSEV